jgi:hypothetical protein
VAPAFAASIVAGMMLRDSSRAACTSASRARSTAAWSRSPRHRASACTRSRSTSGSGVRTPPSSPVVSGESSVSVKQFWPIIFSSPASIRATRSRWDSTRLAFM